MRKSIKVQVLDDTGALVTTGPNSNIFVKLIVRSSYNFALRPPTAQETAVFNNLTNSNELDMWARNNYFMTSNATDHGLTSLGITVCCG